MALSSIVINKNSDSLRNVWIFAFVIGAIAGLAFAGVGLAIGKVAASAKTSFILATLGIGVGAGLLIGWFGREIILGLINLVLDELETKVGLQRASYSSKKTGLSRELDIFDQMFKVVVSILKRVLMISLRLEEASIDLDRTAQISSTVIKEIVDKVDSINKNAVDNASNLRETISSLESSFSLSKDISSKLVIAREDSQGVAEIAQNTQTSVKQSVEKMMRIKELTEGSANLVNDLNDRGKQIGAILTEIANIAEKTNLLALNAAIEAARAGEQGRGFAVVADEVRKLARGSAESSKKINTLINDILVKTENAAEMMRSNTNKVYEGMDVISAVDTSLSNMVDTALKLNVIIKDISDSADRQSQTSDVMYQKVNTISKITDQISQQIQNVASTALSRTVIVDQTTSSARELRTLSDIFQNALVPFKFKVEGANKRAFVRTETRIPCKFKVLLSGELIDGTLSSGDYEMRGVITNLSAGGCLMETTEDIEQGKYIIFAFQLGSQFIQGVQGRLVRLRRSTSASDDAVGKEAYEGIISFNNVSPDHEKVIVDFVLNAQRQFEQNLGITLEI
ncbi:MAG TPA: methyl-accepting chemotaxis protein [Candidatus Ozemobacteraceae bacterium]|nr:methyl-accepting chemotaxis protein [Candidatus Ozemobacteraceae bacterium]HQG27833.1 methyl-accepting chemotaxis protein [Candidatus Ozemobacteraceae bacterium]